MKNRILYIIAYLMGALILNWLIVWLESDFIRAFPASDYLTLLATMFAINVATTNFIISKLNDLKRIYPKANFRKSFASLNSSMIVQLILMIAAIVLLIIRGSSLIANKFDSPRLESVVTILLIFVLLYSVSILWDTGRAMFSISKFEQ